MRIGFEIDGILCWQVPGAVTDMGSVGKLAVIEQAKELLLDIRTSGHQIILYTTRDSSMALETEAWLSKNGIPYDAIIFNRPRMMSLFFAPDARQFTSWDTTRSELTRHGFLQERQTGNEDSRGTEDGRAKKNLKTRHQDKKILDEKPDRTSGPESEKGQSGFQILK